MEYCDLELRVFICNAIIASVIVITIIVITIFVLIIIITLVFITLHYSQGVVFYNIYLKRVSLRKIYFWSSIIGTVLGLSQLLLISGVSRQIGLGDKLFVVGDEVILSVLGEIAFLPSLVLAAKVCIYIYIHI